jgi:septum formation protein
MALLDVKRIYSFFCGAAHAIMLPPTAPITDHPNTDSRPMKSLPSDPLPIVLASSSLGRKALLSRICPQFRSVSPDLDESPLDGETPEQLCLRLAEAKARAVAHQDSDGLIIGSDQVAMLNQTQLRKPMTQQNTIAQLLQCSGKEVQFHTSVCVLNTYTGALSRAWTLNTVTFRDLSEDQVRRYVALEQPYYCAGGFMVEGLGIALFESVRGDDPNALIGLPLIHLISLLDKEGWSPF